MIKNYFKKLSSSHPAIHLIAPVYNESYLLPIFMQNYNYVDKITFLYDTDTTDDSLIQITKNKKANQEIEVVKFNTGDGLNDTIMINLTNDIIKKSDYDYFICVDIDELLFHKDFNFFIKQELNKSKRDFYIVIFFQMYPHQSEKIDLDKKIPIFYQRQHGYFDINYAKPNIIKNNCNFIYVEGKHNLFREGNEIKKENMIVNNISIDNAVFYGCHLNNINLQQSILRRIENRKDRISLENKTKGFGIHHCNTTVESIMKEYEKEYEKLW